MEVLFLLLGILLISMLIPLIDGLTAFILTWLEAKKAKQAEIINEINIKIKEDLPPDTEVVGFGSFLEEKEENDEV